MLSALSAHGNNNFIRDPDAGHVTYALHNTNEFWKTAAVLWDNTPIHITQPNVFNFTKQLKHYLQSEHFENL